MDFETVKAKKRPQFESVPIVLDPDWADELGKAEHRLREKTRTHDTANELLELVEPDERNTAGYRRALSEVESTAAEMAEAQTERDRLFDMHAEKILVFRLRGLAAWEIDELLNDPVCRPTEKQRIEAKNAGDAVPRWNRDTYKPRLVYQALIEPAWTLEQVTEIFHSGEWNVAETDALFRAADGAAMSRRVVDLGEG